MNFWTDEDRAFSRGVVTFGEYSREKYEPRAREQTERLAALRQELQKLPEYRRIINKVSLAGEILFDARVEGYSSIELAVVASNLEKLAQIFDNNIDSFSVFLSAFAPAAFAATFNSYELQDLLRSDVDVPQGVSDAFASPAHADPSDGRGRPPDGGGASRPQELEMMKKANRMWWLANGSLLIPLGLAIWINYYAFKEMNAALASQRELYKPVIEHQTNLFKEDRELIRLLFEQLKPQQAAPAVVRGAVPSRRGSRRRG